MRVYPFLVTDEVPLNDPYLRYLYSLNHINELVFAPDVREIT